MESARPINQTVSSSVPEDTHIERSYPPRKNMLRFVSQERKPGIGRLDDSLFAETELSTLGILAICVARVFSRLRFSFSGCAFSLRAEGRHRRRAASRSTRLFQSGAKPAKSVWVAAYGPREHLAYQVSSSVSSWLVRTGLSTGT